MADVAAIHMFGSNIDDDESCQTVSLIQYVSSSSSFPSGFFLFSFLPSLRMLHFDRSLI